VHSIYLSFIYLKFKKINTHGIYENVFVTITAKWPNTYGILWKYSITAKKILDELVKKKKKT